MLGNHCFDKLAQKPRHLHRSSAPLLAVPLLAAMACGIEEGYDVTAPSAAEPAASSTTEAARAANAVAGDRVPVGSGVAVRFELGDAPDPSVHADLEQLMPDLADLAAPYKAAAAQDETIVVRYTGKGRSGAKRTHERTRSRT